MISSVDLDFKNLVEQDIEIEAYTEGLKRLKKFKADLF
jgi:hypothetical protein